MFRKILIIGFAVTALALAQDEPPGGGGGGGMGPMGGGAGRGMDSGGGGMMPTRQPKPTKADQIISRLKLSKDQVADFEKILQESQKNASPVAQQVIQGENVLANALLSNKGQADIDQASKALADAQFQMTGVEIQAYQKLLALLKPNQVAKAPEAFDLLAGIFLPQSSGGGRGMGRGR